MQRVVISLSSAVALAMSAGAQNQGYGQQGGFGQYPHGQSDTFPSQPQFSQTGQQGQGVAHPSQSPFGQSGHRHQGPAGFQALSGSWLLSSQFGTDKVPWQIQVSPNGQFQGTQGKTRMQGQFQGMTARAQYFGFDNRTSTPVRQPWPVTLQFDGGCHIQMTMRSPQGGQPMQGTFHVNHQAGAPCPN